MTGCRTKFIVFGPHRQRQWWNKLPWVCWVKFIPRRSFAHKERSNKSRLYYERIQVQAWELWLKNTPQNSLICYENTLHATSLDQRRGIYKCLGRALHHPIKYTCPHLRSKSSHPVESFHKTSWLVPYSMMWHSHPLNLPCRWHTLPLTHVSLTHGTSNAHYLHLGNTRLIWAWTSGHDDGGKCGRDDTSPN